MISNGSIYLIVRDFDKLVQFYKLEFENHNFISGY